MSDELKPCPFCGCESGLYNSGDNGNYKEVCCTCCPCNGGDNWPSEKEAVEFWNTRTPGPDVARLQAEVELLRRHIAEQDQTLKEKEGELSRWAYSFIDVERERDELRSAIAEREAAQSAATNPVLTDTKLVADSPMPATAKMVDRLFAYCGKVRHNPSLGRFPFEIYGGEALRIVAEHEAAQSDRPATAKVETLEL